MNRAPGSAAVARLLLNIPVYSVLHMKAVAHICFLNRMAITFGVICLAMAVISLVAPRRDPKPLPVRPDLDVTPSPSVKIAGIAILIATAVLYILFR